MKRVALPIGVAVLALVAMIPADATAQARSGPASAVTPVTTPPRNITCQSGNLCRSPSKPWFRIDRIDVPPIRKRKDPAWCEAEAALAERSRALAEELIHTAGSYRLYPLQSTKKGPGPELVNVSLQPRRTFEREDLADLLVARGLAVYGKPGAVNWCQAAKTHFQQESACTRRVYASWAGRAKAGFDTWYEEVNVFNRHLQFLEACTDRGNGKLADVACESGNRCRTGGQVNALTQIDVPQIPTVPGPGSCEAERVLAERSRDMAEGLILSAGASGVEVAGVRGSGDVPYTEIRVPSRKGPAVWESVDAILIRHGLAVRMKDGARPDWCTQATARLNSESACTRDAWAAWAQRSAAGFATPKDKADAFDAHFEALEACAKK